MPFSSNLLLESLTDNENKALAPHLTKIVLKQHEILFDIGAPITKVYFPIDAVVSLVIPLSTGEAVETAMVGRDGIIGAAAALDGRVSRSRAVVQIGGRAICCDIAPFKVVLASYAAIQRLVAAHEQVLFAEAQQSAACNAAHDLENRLARWLLRAADLHGADDLPLTQEFLSEMLGVRRTSVTLIAATLQRAGMLKYSRGHIKLLDIPALLETACECYQTVKSNYDELLAPSIRDDALTQ